MRTTRASTCTSRCYWMSSEVVRRRPTMQHRQMILSRPRRKTAKKDQARLWLGLATQRRKRRKLTSASLPLHPSSQQAPPTSRSLSAPSATAARPSRAWRPKSATGTKRRTRHTSRRTDTRGSWPRSTPSWQSSRAATARSAGGRIRRGSASRGAGTGRSTQRSRSSSGGGGRRERRQCRTLQTC